MIFVVWMHAHESCLFVFGAFVLCLWIAMYQKLLLGDLYLNVMYMSCFMGRGYIMIDAWFLFEYCLLIGILVHELCFVVMP